MHTPSYDNDMYIYTLQSQNAYNFIIKNNTKIISIRNCKGMPEISHTPLHWLTQNMNKSLELWSVYCEEVGENWLRYNGTTLYTYPSSTVYSRLCCLQHYVRGEMHKHI